MIRKSVTQDELLVAMQPLLDLLGVESPWHIFAEPPLTIGGLSRSGNSLGHVSFAYVVPAEDSDPGEDRPKGTRLHSNLQAGTEWTEVMQYVTVGIV